MNDKLAKFIMASVCLLSFGSITSCGGKHEALSKEGWKAYEEGNYAEAEKLFAEARDELEQSRWRELWYLTELAGLYENLAMVLEEQGRSEEARAALIGSLDYWKKWDADNDASSGFSVGRLKALKRLAGVEVKLGNCAEATKICNSIAEVSEGSKYTVYKTIDMQWLVEECRETIEESALRKANPSRKEEADLSMTDERYDSPD